METALGLLVWFILLGGAVLGAGLAEARDENKRLKRIEGHAAPLYFVPVSTRRRR